MHPRAQETATQGDGNGWVTCARGHRHWGRFGAAGLLVADGNRVLLQHRSEWTHEGGTWALPGGARDSHEDAVSAALRETSEETSLDPGAVEPVHEFVDDHGGWAYTTVLARGGTGLAQRPVAPANEESTAVSWWLVDEVTDLPLHRGFARTWPAVRALLGSDSRP